MCQKGFLVNNNLRGQEIFRSFCFLWVQQYFCICIFLPLQNVSNMPGRLQTKSKNVWKILFCILTFESLPPAPIFHPHPYYAILTHGITKGWLCIDGGSGILSIWLNQQKIIKHKGWRRKKSEPSILPFYLLPLLPAHATSSHCKQGGNI